MGRFRQITCPVWLKPQPSGVFFVHFLGLACNRAVFFRRYRELQQYVNWTEEDAQRVRQTWRGRGAPFQCVGRRLLRCDPAESGDYEGHHRRS